MKHPDFDDVGDAIREDRPLREVAVYRIRFGLEGLTFRHIDVPDPVPTGRQILDSAGLDRRVDYLLFALLASGDFEDIRLDETVDLRGKGAERFIAFKSDRDFKFALNDRQMAWGRPELLGSVLYDLAEAMPEEAIFLEGRGGEDRLVEPDERVNLDAPGIERFITAPRPKKGYVSLGGILRVTTSTAAKRDHIHAGRISFEGGGGQDVYASNIQVADLNALNACLAVVKWKKLRGFYRDLENEHHSTYTTDGGMLLNGDQS